MTASPLVKIDQMTRDGEGYVARGYRWATNDLIEAAKRCKPFSMPLAGIDMSGMPWNITCYEDILWHIKRVNETSLEHPIILDHYGCIANGWHRIAKAVLEGKRTIMAVRLEEMPRSEEVK